MNIVIFADHHTKKRVLAVVGVLEECKGLQADLNKYLGGSWVWVNELKFMELLSFEADKEYHGWDSNPNEDYCGKIIDLFEMKHPGLKRFQASGDGEGKYEICSFCRMPRGTHKPRLVCPIQQPTKLDNI